MRTVPTWLTAAFLLLVLCTAAVTWRHEAWLDETDSWLLVRDGGVRTVLARTGYEGAPALWYLLLAPLAAVGLPFAAQQVLNLLIAWAALGLFVYKAPFRPVLKVTFLFSYFAAYEFSVIARSYALLMALLFAIAVAWRWRTEHPVRLAWLVVLIANVSGHGLIIGAAVGAAFLIEAVHNKTLQLRTSVPAIVLMMAGGALSFFQLRVPADGPRVLRHFDPGTLPFALGAIVLPFTDPRISFSVGLLLLLVVTVAVGRSAIPLAFLWLAMTALLAFYQFVWYGGVRHSGVLLLVIVASLWIGWEYEAVEPWRDRAFRIAEYALAIGLALSIPATFRWWRADFTEPFSGSRETAAFISQHVGPNVILAAHPAIQCEAVLAYLPGRRFWYAALGRFGSYMEWGRELDEAQLRAIDVPAEVRRRFGERGWILVKTSPVADAGKERLHLVFQSRTPFAASRESYWIYEPITRPQ